MNENMLLIFIALDEDAMSVPPGGEPFLLEADMGLPTNGSTSSRFTRVSRDRLEAMAIANIDTIAKADEFVSPRKVEVMLLSQTGAKHIKDLGIRRMEDLKAVSDLSRKLGQVRLGPQNLHMVSINNQCIHSFLVCNAL